MKQEGPRHFIDIDHYGRYPYDSLPRKWNDAAVKYSEDSLNMYGIVPWWLQTMLVGLTNASFEDRNGIIIRQHSSAFSKAYDLKMKGMVESRMRLSIFSVASFWYTAWVNAGQPDLTKPTNKEFSAEDLKEFESLNNLEECPGQWKRT